MFPPPPHFSPTQISLEMSQSDKLALKLIEYGCELDFQNEYGQTALFVATQYGHHEVALKLIENGCDISGHVYNILVQTIINMLEEHALLIYNAIDSAQNVYEDFTKELVPFLTRSDFAKLWK